MLMASEDAVAVTPPVVSLNDEDVVGMLLPLTVVVTELAIPPPLTPPIMPTPSSVMEEERLGNCEPMPLDDDDVDDAENAANDDVDVDDVDISEGCI